MNRISGVLRRVAAVGAAGALVAGCTDSSAGSPRPQGDASRPPAGESSETSAPTSSGTEPGPARPRELRLDGKDPCSLVPQADRANFYIERPGLSGQDEVFKSPECVYSTDVGGFNITLVMTEGIERWTDGSRSGQAKEVAPVAGFPAISVTTPTVKHGCYVAVDTADGQYLLTTVIVTSSKASQVPERCEYAHQLAESAMSTLVGA